METKINLNFSWAVILGFIFIILKLCGVITWSWVWVLCPIWISIIIATIAFIVCYIIINKEMR